MKKYIAFLGVAVLIFNVILLCGCNEEKKTNNNNGDGSGFVGEWNMVTTVGDDVWTFYSGNTGKRVVTSGGEPYTDFFTWKLNDSNLCISFQTSERCGTYSFTNESNTFTWTVLRGNEPLVTTFNKKI